MAAPMVNLLTYLFGYFTRVAS